MSDEAALLRAIHAEPDEDTPRLVYADWLDEHDQPERAEFIRLQIEHANLDDYHGDEGRKLGQHEYELTEAHEKQWIAHLLPFDESKIGVRFERGFPEELEFRRATADDFTLLRRLPALRALRISDAVLTPDVIRDIVRLRHLDQLLIEDTRLEPSWLELFEPLPCWTCFNTDMWHRDEEWETVAGWGAFQERRISKVIELPQEEQRSAALRFVGGRPHKPVRSLKWYKQRISDSELRFLSYLPELEEIEIQEGLETVDGIRHLSGLPNLKRFALIYTECESLVPLMRCTTLEHLEYHTLGANFGDKAVVGLERLTNLRHLELCPQPGDGLRDASLFRIGALRELRELRIVLERLEDKKSLRALANLTKLESLSLEGSAYYEKYKGEELRIYLEGLKQQ